MLQCSSLLHYIQKDFITLTACQKKRKILSSFVYLSHTSTGSAAASTLHSPGQDPHVSLSGSGASSPAPPTTNSTSGSFITLAVPSSLAPIVVTLAGSLLYAGALHRGNPSQDTWDSQKGEGYGKRIGRGKGNYALTSFPLSFWTPWNHFGIRRSAARTVVTELVSLWRQTFMGDKKGACHIFYLAETFF